MDRSSRSRPRSYASHGSRSGRSERQGYYDSDEDEGSSGRNGQGGRNPRRSRRSSRCSDDHAYGDDQFADEDDEPRFPGPLINPVPIPVVGGFVPPMSYREAMVPGGMEPGGSSRKFEKAKKEKKKQYNHGPLPALRESWDEAFEVGPPIRVQDGAVANLEAIAEAAPYLKQNFGIPNYLGNLQAMALPVPILPKPKLPEVTSMAQAVGSNMNRIENFVDAPKHEQDKNVAGLISGLPEAMDDISFTESEPEETVTVPTENPYKSTPEHAAENLFTDSVSQEIPASMQQQKLYLKDMENFDDYGFTDSESEGEEKPSQPPKCDPKEDLTFTDSEAEEPATGKSGPSVPINNSNVASPEDKGDYGFTDTESEEELMAAPLERKTNASNPVNLEGLNFSDSEPEEDTENGKYCVSAQTFKENQNVAVASYEGDSDYGFTDTESEEEALVATLERKKVTPNSVDLENLTFTDSETEDAFANELNGNQNTGMPDGEGDEHGDYGFTDTESEDEGKAVPAEPAKIEPKPKPAIEIFIWSDTDED